jgi:hypothetical protein
MSLWGFAGSSVCLFCHGWKESKGHLFFNCSFSRRIWRALMNTCLVKDPPVEWDNVVRWFTADLQGISLKSSVCRLCLATVVYHLWRQRNDLLHGNTPK